MKLIPVTQSKWRRGVWITGGRDTIPEGTVRRGSGLNAIRTDDLRSRGGATAVWNPGGYVTGLFKFNGKRFFTAANNASLGSATNVELIRVNGDGTITNLAAYGTPPYQSRIMFAKMPPAVGFADHLYFTNPQGQLPQVFRPSDATVWAVGLAAPVSGPTLAAGTQTVTAVADLSADAANWTIIIPDGSAKVVGVSNDNTYFQSLGGATASLHFTTIGTNSVQFGRRTGLSFDATIGGTSPDTDLIQMWFSPTNTQIGIGVVVNFLLGGTTTDYFSFYFPFAQPFSQNQSLANQGLNSVLGGSTANSIEENFILHGAVPGVGYISDPAVQTAIASQLNQSGSASVMNPWFLLNAAKRQFTRIGNNTGLGWANVTGMEIRPQGNGSGTGSWGLWVGNPVVIGGTGPGLQGNYQYAVVFADNKSGIVSNPFPANATSGLYTTIKGLLRQGVTVSNIPISTNPRTTSRLIYRSLGNGATLFFAHEIADNVTTSWVDNVSDYPGALNGNETAVLGATTLWPVQLQTDNTQPVTGLTRVAGPFLGSMFWCGDPAQPGRLYYSATGRPESIENWINVTFNDDPLQQLIVYSGNLYLLSQKRLFQIQQVSTDPLLFTAVPILGEPGTIYPWSPAIGKRLLFYQTGEGFISFDGFSGRPFGMEAMEPVFRGEYPEELQPLSIQTIAYVKGELIMSNALNETLAINEDDQTWRSLGQTYGLLYYEEDSEDLLAVLGTGGEIVVAEVPGVGTDNGTNISIDWQPASVLIGEDIEGVVRRIVFDIDTGSNALTPTLIVDDADLLSAWASNLTTAVGYRVLDPNNNIQQVTTAGITGSDPPAWSTALGAATTDGQVTWTLQGPGQVVLPILNTARRDRVEYNVAVRGKLVTVRLTGSTSGMVRWYMVKYIIEAGE